MVLLTLSLCVFGLSLPPVGSRVALALLTLTPCAFGLPPLGSRVDGLTLSHLLSLSRRSWVPEWTG